MFDFVNVKDQMPDDGAEVEVLRTVGYFAPTGYCRYSIERTIFSNGMFVCDMVSTGHVQLWRPADFTGEVATANDYPGLKALFAEDKQNSAEACHAAEELAPCPFCGAAPTCVDLAGWEVYCRNCGASGPTVFAGTTNETTLRADAIETWNKRANASFTGSDAAGGRSGGSDS